MPSSASTPGPRRSNRDALWVCSRRRAALTERLTPSSPARHSHCAMTRHTHGSDPEGMKPTNYEITVRGRIGLALADAFQGMTASVSATETLLRGRIVDQAALHGVLELIESLGLELLDVRRVDATTDPTHMRKAAPCPRS